MVADPAGPHKQPSGVISQLFPYSSSCAVSPFCASRAVLQVGGQGSSLCFEAGVLFLRHLCACSARCPWLLLCSAGGPLPGCGPPLLRQRPLWFFPTYLPCPVPCPPGEAQDDDSIHPWVTKQPLEVASAVHSTCSVCTVHALARDPLRHGASQNPCRQVWKLRVREAQ